MKWKTQFTSQEIRRQVGAETHKNNLLHSTNLHTLKVTFHLNLHIYLDISQIFLNFQTDWSQMINLLTSALHVH